MSNGLVGFEREQGVRESGVEAALLAQPNQEVFAAAGRGYDKK
jgi:hypothetical protein